MFLFLLTQLYINWLSTEHAKQIVEKNHLDDSHPWLSFPCQKYLENLDGEVCGISHVSMKWLKGKQGSWEAEAKTKGRTLRADEKWVVNGIVPAFDHNISSSPSPLKSSFQYSLLMSLLPKSLENEVENICSDLFFLERELADGGMIGYIKLPMLWNFKHISSICVWEVQHLC